MPNQATGLPVKATGMKQPHVHQYTYAGRNRIRFGETLYAACPCGWRKTTVIAEHPPKYGVSISKTRYKPKARTTTTS